MIFDHMLFERYISRRESINEPVSFVVRIGYAMFKSPIFAAFVSVIERLITFILTLPIPLYRSLIQGFIINLPGTPNFSGVYLRALYFKGKLKHLGKNVILEEGIKIVSPQNVEIHDNCVISKGVILAGGRPKKYANHKIIKLNQGENEGQLIIKDNVNIASYVTIGGMGGMTIGEYTGIGPHCSIYSYAHLSMNPYVACQVSTTIGSYVAIGTNSSLICVKQVPDKTYIRPNTFLKDSFLNKGN